LDRSHVGVVDHYRGDRSDKWLVRNLNNAECQISPSAKGLEGLHAPEVFKPLAPHGGHLMSPTQIRHYHSRLL
jgi:hypothetical protein